MDIEETDSEIASGSAGRRGFRRSLTALAATAAACLLGARVDARGLGRIEDGKLDLLVYFAYAEDDPAAWEPMFDEASKLLSNATEGGLQFGTVTFTTCADLGDDADVWILPDTSGARSHISGLGIPGRHVTLSQTHEQTSGGAKGHFGLVHELGHYLFGVYDEYRGFVGDTPTRTSLHFCSFDLSTVSCIMDGGTTVTPNNSRTEFCTRVVLGFPETGHNPGIQSFGTSWHRTDQEYYLHRSCWEQVERSGVGGLKHPGSEPVQAQPAHTPVTFDYDRYVGDLGIAVVLDRSGSMSAEGRLTEALVGLANGVDLVRDRESLALVAFDDVPSVVFSSASMDDAGRAAAKAALATVVPGGGTMLGNATLTAVSQLEAFDSCVEFVLVVTDGASESPTIDDPAVLAALTAGGYAVHAVAIGSFPETSALASVASATGGAFYALPDSIGLSDLVATILATVGRGGLVVMRRSETLAAFGALSDTLDVVPGTRALRLSAAHHVAADVELVATDPNGVVRSSRTPTSGFTVRASEGHLFAELGSPTPGEWTIELRETSGVATSAILLGVVETDALRVRTRAPRPVVDHPAPIVVEASVVASVPVGGARVVATVHRPDGSTVDVELVDDGRAANGDAVASDGVYSVAFERVVGDGAYTFDIAIDARDAHAVSSEECGVYGLALGGSLEDGGDGATVPPFRAFARHSVVLRGQDARPDPGRVRLEPHGAFAAQGAPGSVTVDGERVVVAAFDLVASSEEAALLDAIDARVAEAPLAWRAHWTVALHVDGDHDGRVDAPSVPLALARPELVAGELRLTFTTDARRRGALARIPAGERLSLLLTLGNGFDAGRVHARPPSGPDEGGVVPVAPEGAAASGGAGSVRPFVERSSALGADALRSNAARFGATLVAALAFVVLGLRVAGSSRGVRADRRGRRAASARRARLARAALLGALALGAGCSGRGANDAPPRLALTVDAHSIECRGAITGAALPVEGDAGSFAVEVR